MDRNEIENEGMTRSKGPQSGIEHRTTAERMQPLYMGRPIYQLSQRGVPQMQTFSTMMHLTAQAFMIIFSMVANLFGENLIA